MPYACRAPCLPNHKRRADHAHRNRAFFSIGMWAIAVSCLRARHLSVALVIAYVPRCLRLPSFLCSLHC